MDSSASSNSKSEENRDPKFFDKCSSTGGLVGGSEWGPDPEIQFQAGFKNDQKNQTKEQQLNKRSKRDSSTSDKNKKTKEMGDQLK